MPERTLRILAPLMLTCGVMADGTALLLGCGSLGMAAACLLGRDRAFQQVITADQDSQRAAAAAELCGSKAEAVQLDCLDDGSLRQALEDVALVINTVRLALPEAISLIRSVLEGGVSYADASSDPEVLQAIFDSEYLGALAGYRAVSAVPGLGASPGLTNALTSYLGQRLERVDEASFLMVDDLRRSSFRHWRERLSDFSASALVWRDSDWSYVEPLSEWSEIAFPPPQGSVFASTVSLGPVTLPGSIGTLAHVSSHRGFSDPAMLDVVRNLVLYGFGSDVPVETAAGSLSPAEFAATLFSRSQGGWAPGSLLDSAFGSGEFNGPMVRQAQVAGMLRGRKTRFTMTYHFPGEEDVENVAATLATGARMLITREVPAPGVHPPESLDPAPFLWDMERRGVEIRLTKAYED